MNEIKVTVNFKRRKIVTSGVDLTSGDYNSTKLVFDFDIEEGTKIFEMNNPNGTLIYTKEIINNEVPLYVLNENEQKSSLFNQAGEYKFEVSLYNGDSKLTSATSSLNVEQETVIIGDEEVEAYLPVFDELMNDIDTAITETNNLDLDVNKEGNTTTVTLTKKDGTTKSVQILDGSGGGETPTYNNLLYETLDLTDANKVFTGYIYNGVYLANQNWRSYEFKAENIDKIISLAAYSDSSAYKNINFYDSYVKSSDDFSSHFISSVNLTDGANKVNNYSNVAVPSNCKAIIISHKIQETMATPTVSLRRKKYDQDIEEIRSDIVDISNSASNIKKIYKNIWNANDFVFIKDELWLTKPNSSYTGYDQEIRRYKLIDDEWVEQAKIYTDFGHWNTVDYCPENDCLIFSNSANSESTTGNYFTVVKNPLALSGSVLTQNVGIKYNVDIGFKVQAVWGNDNMGEYNIVYLTSNYTRRIVKVLLGKDGNGDFDGTYITLSDNTLTQLIGTGGGDFWGDCIYIGDGGNTYAIWKLSVTDFTAQKIDRTAYLANGTAINGSTQGVYVDKDYMWVFYNIGGSSDNYLVQYYRGGLTNKPSDAHINELIDVKLGVIENGSY